MVAVPRGQYQSSPYYLIRNLVIEEKGVELHGRGLGHSAQDQRIPGLSPCRTITLSPLHVQMCSSTGQRLIRVWFACDSCT
jgi:hypothetical protein